MELSLNANVLKGLELLNEEGERVYANENQTKHLMNALASKYLTKDIEDLNKDVAIIMTSRT